MTDQFPVSIITNGYFTPALYNDPHLGFKYVYGEKVNFRLSRTFTKCAAAPLSATALENIEKSERMISDTQKEYNKRYKEYLADILNREKKKMYEDTERKRNEERQAFKDMLEQLRQSPATHDLCVFQSAQEQLIGLNIPVEYSAALPFMSAAGYIIVFDFPADMLGDVTQSPPTITLKKPQDIIRKPLQSAKTMKL